MKKKKMKLRTRWIIAGIILFVFYMIGIFNHSNLGFIAGLIFAAIYLILTSEQFRKWDKERVKRLKREREEARKLQREAYYKEMGKQKATRDFGERETERKEHQKRIQHFRKNLGFLDIQR